MSTPFAVTLFEVLMRIARLIPLLAILLLALHPEAVSASPDGDVGFLAQPAAGSSMDPGGGYFLIPAVPGAVVHQAVALRNDADVPLDLRLAAVDATTANLGGTAFALDDDAKAKTATWISLAQTTVTLPPQGSLTVPFTVTVPSDAAGGVHLAGISVLAPVAAKSAGLSDAGQAGASVDVQSRRVIAVQVDLPGPADPELVITGVSPVARPDGLYVEIGIENRGRGLTQADGQLTLPDDGFEQSFKIGTFVPGTSIAFPVKWTGETVRGDRSGRVEIRYGGRVAVWHGTLTVGEVLLEEQAKRQTQPPSSPPRPVAASFPIGLAALGAAAALLFLGVGIFAGRRSRATVS